MNSQFLENNKVQVEQMVARIVQRVPVEKIWLLGYTLMQESLESVFGGNSGNRSFVRHYYLLVLIKTASQMNKDAIQDKIENNCRMIVPATAVVLDTHQYNTWVLKAHHFARLVNANAVLLYSSSNAFVSFENSAAPELMDTAISENRTAAVNKVDQCIAAAELFMLRHQNRMAVCMLQIAVKLALQHIFKSATGLNFSTDNLDKWLRYCSLISGKVGALFPKETDRNKRLFALLQKADLVKGYTDELRVYKTDLAEILERVKKLKRLMLESNADYR